MADAHGIFAGLHTLTDDADAPMPDASLDTQEAPQPAVHADWHESVGKAESSRAVDADLAVK